MQPSIHCPVNMRQIRNYIDSRLHCLSWSNGKKSTTFTPRENGFLLFNQESDFELDTHLQEHEQRVASHFSIFYIWRWEIRNLSSSEALNFVSAQFSALLYRNRISPRQFSFHDTHLLYLLYRPITIMLYMYMTYQWIWCLRYIDAL